jgi:shikimate dehydrogenase
MRAPSSIAPSQPAPVVRLGLIGDNIRDSRSPDLHRLAGRLCGLDVRYELIVPQESGQPFDAVFDACQRDGLRGVNVTYPYKERVVSRLTSRNADVARVGSANTVVFEPDGPAGYNTDYLGFIAAYRVRFGDRPPGRVALVGAGGVGRAIAFALVGLGASELRIFDTDQARADRLAAALSALIAGESVQTGGDIGALLRGADGVVNCTPIGMTGKPGSAVPPHLLGRRGWAFDAVYTPVETQFLAAAANAGLDTLTGYELFFHQGVSAFELFTGRLPPLEALRRELGSPPQHKEMS